MNEENSLAIIKSIDNMNKNNEENSLAIIKSIDNINDTLKIIQKFIIKNIPNNNDNNNNNNKLITCFNCGTEQLTVSVKNNFSGCNKCYIQLL